jgi:hypothetical protein
MLYFNNIIKFPLIISVLNLYKANRLRPSLNIIEIFIYTSTYFKVILFK